MKRTNIEALDAAQILAAEGLSADAWTLTGYRTWGSADNEQKYVSVVPKKPEGLIVPARMPGDYKRKAVKAANTKRSKLVVYISDQHAPYHDVKLHELTLQWLREYQPNRVILGGDLLEFDTISRHRSKPQDGAVQKAIDAGYGLLRDYVQAAPKAEFQLLPGNHDIRLQHLVIDLARELYGIRKGSVGDEVTSGALSLETLLRCDELGIEYVSGSWENAQVAITPTLGARHGYKALSASGKTAHATMAHLGHSIIHGHCHRQAITHRTIYDVAGQPSTQIGVEAGCMCNLSLAENYMTQADWQQGFAVVTVQPNGLYHAELATYVKGKLFFRDTYFA